MVYWYSYEPCCTRTSTVRYSTAAVGCTGTGTNTRTVRAAVRKSLNRLLAFLIYHGIYCKYFLEMLAFSVFFTPVSTFRFGFGRISNWRQTSLAPKCTVVQLYDEEYRYPNIVKHKLYNYTVQLSFYLSPYHRSCEYFCISSQPAMYSYAKFLLSPGAMDFEEQYGGHIEYDIKYYFNYDALKKRIHQIHNGEINTVAVSIDFSTVADERCIMNCNFRV